jgi:hypothetical protein
MWTIWYKDNKVIGSTFEEWQQAPSSEVLAVYRLYERKETYNLGKVCLGSDWYWMTPDKEIGESLQTSDLVGEWTPNNAPAEAVSKSGIWASEERMEEVYLDIKRLIEE